MILIVVETIKLEIARLTTPIAPTLKHQVLIHLTQRDALLMLRSRNLLLAAIDFCFHFFKDAEDFNILDREHLDAGILVALGTAALSTELAAFLECQESAQVANDALACDTLSDYEGQLLTLTALQQRTNLFHLLTALFRLKILLGSLQQLYFDLTGWQNESSWLLGGGFGWKGEWLLGDFLGGVGILTRIF